MWAAICFCPCCTLWHVVRRTTPEARETLEILVNWCDLCLPANEQAFAEAHRIKIQHFQASLVRLSRFTAPVEPFDFVLVSLVRRACAGTPGLSHILCVSSHGCRGFSYLLSWLPRNTCIWFPENVIDCVHNIRLFFWSGVPPRTNDYFSPLLSPPLHRPTST